jgi:hypothetical protein
VIGALGCGACGEAVQVGCASGFEVGDAEARGVGFGAVDEEGSRCWRWCRFGGRWMCGHFVGFGSGIVSSAGRAGCSCVVPRGLSVQTSVKDRGAILSKHL